ncbi:MAG: hypothetical protein AAB250_13735 [Bdellovibrionota bacterium]
MPVVIALSGGAGRMWAPILEREAARRGLDAVVVILPGSLSTWRGEDRVKTPNEDLTSEVSGRLVLFLDDSCSTGDTANRVSDYFQSKGNAFFAGSFFAFDGGSADGVSLLKVRRIAPNLPMFHDLNFGAIGSQAPRFEAGRTRIIDLSNSPR